MRCFPGIQIARITLLRIPALLRCFCRRTQDSQRRLSIAGVASISILLSGVWCAGAATGEEFIEPGSPVPEVPMVDAYTSSENPGGIDLSTPQGFDDGCPMNYEMPHLEHPDQYSSNDSFPANDSGYADEYSPMATSEILMPMTSAPVMLLPKTFVHARKTVRTSERMAEIWVKLPKDSQSSVSVNFVEHPPEGDFRIFRTSINTHEPRRFYLSAKRWDVHANHWIDLVAVPSLSSDETPDLGYIDLGPGQRRVVTFTDCPSPEACVDVPSIHARLMQIEADIFKNHTEVKVMLGGTDTPLAKTAENILGNTTSIKDQVAVLQQSVAPHDKSYGVTKAFHFSTTEKPIAGEANVEMTHVKSVNWGSHPETLNIIATSVPRALPRIPFTADVTFMIQAEGQAPFETLAPFPVEFHETANGFEGEVDFNVHLATPLANAFANQPFPSENLQLAARMEFTLDHGELGLTRVSGELGNKIELKITQ